MTGGGDFQGAYAAALYAYLAAPGEAGLAVGHELGRRALQDRISMLEIIENHFRLVDGLSAEGAVDTSAALQFLLQALAALDIATRGFLEGTRRYEQQRARAEDLALRDEFRTALVNSLQEGFFVADRGGAVIEINSAFAQMTGYGPENLPYRWPHPWMADQNSANDRLSQLLRDGRAQYEVAIRHADGHSAWVAVSINAVTATGAGGDAFVGTIRDVTSARAAAAREAAVMRLATAVGVASSVADVLSITLEECRAAIDVRRVVAVVWPAGDGEPTIQVAGQPHESGWRGLDPVLRATLQDARNLLPLTVEPVPWADDPSKSRGILAVLSGAGDLALWLEHSEPRRVSAEDRMLVTALVGHLSLGMQHVLQFESARDTSLTLQRAMLAPLEPPAGFAVRYEPAVPPLEIGGDWYDVLPLGDHRIGLIVGDCVGRGLSAAAIMGQLRSSARALLLAGAEPALVLEQLDTVAAHVTGAFFTTVFLGILDTESRILRYSSAGHLPAILTAPGSAATLVSEAQSVPLAVHRAHSRPQSVQLVPPDATLMLFTDGLVERRNRPIDEGLERVTSILMQTTDVPVDDVADTVLRTLAPAGGFDDDVAIVVCRPPPQPLRIETDADPHRLIEIRHRLAAWLRGAAVAKPLITDIVLAVSEACTNSVEHAYRDQEPGELTVTAQIDGAEILARVVDRGSWKPAPAAPRTRGRGLTVMRAVAERVSVEGTLAGTTVDMCFRSPDTADTAAPSRSGRGRG